MKQTLNINIKDIARISGVSISTVSRVINNTGYVSEATRQKVFDVINEYHYTPNTSARNLKLTQSRNVGLMVKGIENPFFQLMTREIERILAMRGYSMLIQDTGNKNEMETAQREARNNSLCGVILMGGYSTYTPMDFQQLGVPCVLLTVKAAASTDPALYSSVVIDDEREGFRATNELIEMGHRRIGFIYSHPFEKNTPNALRYMGYLRALREHGIPIDENLVGGMDESVAMISSEGGFRTGFRMAQRLLEKNPDMTALFCFSDTIAIGAAKAILASGRSIPEDISLIGFDGIDEAEFFHPSLDTICQPASEMANAAVYQLLDCIQSGHTGQHIVCRCSFLRRGSTRSI